MSCVYTEITERICPTCKGMLVRIYFFPPLKGYETYRCPNARNCREYYQSIFKLKKPRCKYREQVVCEDRNYCNKKDCIQIHIAKTEELIRRDSLENELYTMEGDEN